MPMPQAPVTPSPHQIPAPVQADYPAYPSQYKTARDQRQKQHRGQNLRLGCGLVLGLILLMGVCLGSLTVAALYVAPVKANLLLLGIDRVPNGTVVGRSDTLVLMRVDSAQPGVTTLSIPRDLWVKIPGNGENRINTAHFFAEAAKPGSGPAGAMQAVQEDLGVPVSSYIRVRLEGVPGLIDAMGGVTVDLPEPMAGYAVGKHRLNGTESLAFVRDRKGTDDFFRMDQGEFFIKAAAQELLNPLTWPRFPLIYSAFWKAVDTNLSIWQLANIGVTVVRVGPAKINSHVLPREYTTPTNLNGASVLLPKWELIKPLVNQLFK